MLTSMWTNVSPKLSKVINEKGDPFWCLKVQFHLPGLFTTYHFFQLSCVKVISCQTEHCQSSVRVCVCVEGPERGLHFNFNDRMRTDDEFK